VYIKLIVTLSIAEVLGLVWKSKSKQFEWLMKNIEALCGDAGE
jgi:hypothetical protein